MAPRSFQGQSGKNSENIYFNTGIGAVIDHKELVLTHSSSDIIGRLGTVSNLGGGGG